MLRRANARLALGLAALAAAGVAGYASAELAGPPAAQAGLAEEVTDPEPAPEPTVPAPDPAPTPAPAPKPQPKPAAPPAARAPRTSRPVATRVRTPVTRVPTYTPPQRSSPAPAQRRTTPARAKVKRAKKKPVRKERAQAQTVETPAPIVPPTHAPRVGLKPAPAALAPSSSDGAKRFVITSGLGLAALLFLVAFALPSAAVRRTVPGRALLEHQAELLVAGIGALALTAVLFVWP